METRIWDYFIGFIKFDGWPWVFYDKNIFIFYRTFALRSVKDYFLETNKSLSTWTSDKQDKKIFTTRMKLSRSSTTNWWRALLKTNDKGSQTTRLVLVLENKSTNIFQFLVLAQIFVSLIDSSLQAGFGIAYHINFTQVSYKSTDLFLIECVVVWNYLQSMIHSRQGVIKKHQLRE